MKKVIKLIFCVLACEAVGMAGALFTISAIPTWYVTLAKPPMNPPNWVFGPAWTALYLLMGVSAFLIWEKGLDRKEVRTALELFGLQLFFNAAWTPIFFGVKEPLAALLVIILLWVTLIETIVKFYTLSRAAGMLLIPYILWISFAAYLNAGIWYLNK
ncbi:MAG TPA: tryptophan-rich sensory protein [bacterium]|nr:tryptophan-rich sensory protein [bacterium]